MTQKQKGLLVRIVISAIYFTVGSVLDVISSFSYDWVLFIAGFLIAGYSVAIKAIKNIRHGQVFDENFLMLIASVGAIALGEYAEGTAVIILYQMGELFESLAVGKSRKSIKELISIAPDYANILSGGELKKVDPYEVSVGDIILVKSGEKVPLDGVVAKGSSVMNTCAITGESAPKDVNIGDEVLSGYINSGNTIEVKVTKDYEDSTVSKILYLVEEATNNKSKSESFITRFSKFYTPTVVLFALLIAIVPTIITKDYSTWINRGLLFLVISCPCALVISVPLSFFCAIGKGSREGILIKGSNFLETLSKVNTAVFDKTGTLTKGEFKVSEIHPKDIDESELLKMCAYAEVYSNHPIAVCVRKKFKEKINTELIKSSEQIGSLGVRVNFDGKDILVGNEELLKKENIIFEKADTDLCVLYICENGKYKGYITVEDEIKIESRSTLSELGKEGISETVMLTGDRKSIGEYYAKKIGIDKSACELLPNEKVYHLKEIKKEGKTVMYVGDGMNDAPVLIEADVGISMGSIGSASAVEASDIVIMDDNLKKIPEAFKLSKKTMKIVKENITLSLAVKFGIMILGAVGFANMWLAIFGDVGVTMIAILNALRLQK